MEIVANLGFNWWSKDSVDWRIETLIEEAASSGANSICVPYYRADKIHRAPNAVRAFKKFNTSIDFIERVQELSEIHSLILYVAPNHVDGVDDLIDIGVDHYHVENGSIQYDPLLQKLSGKRVLLSTGFAAFEEVDIAANMLLGSDFNNPIPDLEDNGLILLHSTGALPTPANEAQLMRILDLQQEFFPLYVGVESFFADRLLDFVAMAFRPAVFMRRLDLVDGLGIDNPFSVSPSELKTVVNIASAMQSVNNPVFYEDGFVEGDYNARSNRMRCQSTDYTLPPEN